MSEASSACALKRAEELDALDAILPFDRRDQLARLLTDDDGHSPPTSAILRLGANWPRKAPATVRRRLTSWSILTKWRGLQGCFDGPSLKSALRLAMRASARPRQRKSKKAVTADILAKLLQACGGERLVDLRDRALLLAAFASGGRRRSEVAALRVEDLVDEDPVRADPNDMASPPLPCLSIRLGRTKTTTSYDDEHVLLIGRPVVALKHWLDAAQIKEGPVFRRIDQWGNVDRRALTPQSVNLILKNRCKQAGLDPSVIFGAWIAVRLSHRGRQSWHSPSRSDAAVAAQVGHAGGELLQQSEGMDEQHGWLSSAHFEQVG